MLFRRLPSRKKNHFDLTNFIHRRTYWLQSTLAGLLHYQPLKCANFLKSPIAVKVHFYNS